MKNLFSAIYTKVTAEVGGVHNSFYTAIGGRFYLDHAPQKDAVMPYCIYSLISNPYDYLFKEQFEAFQIQFSIFSNTGQSSEAADIYEYLKALFDWCTLTVTGYAFLRCLRELAHLEWISEERCWMYVIQYRIELQKS